MPANHLEQLVGEWYTMQGYFVRRNVHVGKRKAGGYKGELDVVAFHPREKHLVHVETSLDAQSWATREAKFERKFEVGRESIYSLFHGADPARDRLEQYAVLVFSPKNKPRNIGGCPLMHASEFLARVMRDLKDRRIASRAVPEDLPLIRTLQYVTEYRKAIRAVWDEE